MATNQLDQWINDNGRGAWRKLVTAVQAEIPSFSGGLMSDYARGKRSIPFPVAAIISRETGIPLSRLPFRYIHSPTP